MPRKPKQPVSPEPNNYAQKLWEVFEHYFYIDVPANTELAKMTKGNGPIFLAANMHGAVRTEYNLADKNKQEQLFRSFVQITKPEQALSWASEFGLPISQTNNLAEAANLCALKDLIEAAAFMRHLLRVNQAVKTAKYSHDNETSWLEDYLKLEPDLDFGNYVKVAFVPHENEQYMDKITKVCQGTSWLTSSFLECGPLVWSYSKDQWDKDPKRWLIYSARHFLKTALDYLVKEICPTLEWRYESKSSTYDLVPTFIVPNPWQAIVLELYRQVTSTSTLRKCLKKDCFVMGAWRKNRYYCSEAHQKWCERNQITIRKNRKQK